ncbi:GapA-binding peptide SR1P [Shouchella shacheensis]|nr:GapA-binding peptide SR1P [Shouchella shacheensis]
MGTLVCQNCNEAIEHFEGEKVTRLYATSCCNKCQASEEEPLSN